MLSIFGHLAAPVRLLSFKQHYSVNKASRPSQSCVPIGADRLAHKVLRGQPSFSRYNRRGKPHGQNSEGLKEDDRTRRMTGVRGGGCVEIEERLLPAHGTKWLSEQE